ncbi:uncharacterized protein cubi_02994 [Cryptosporidium ubiquitum]|uniref:Uncharacterized protein n=1 Tax=Cryptosporidium ubiquitum TaxID=857276 RepID=A0A1J4MKZ8_9CRYT|nr:uncharacterized protein cubi_02994 [Cryptosporidium ubiquitum]OII74862.1 hypothetical protein cubi_02994 [Cryptosporidium ubiquitum]
MNWRHTKGFNEIEDLLKRVRDIELLCVSAARIDKSSNIESEYTKHKIRLFELYNTASTILDGLESNTNQTKFLIKIKLEDLINQMKIEIQELRKIHNKYYSPNLHISGLAKKDDKFLEIEDYEREFIAITQSRFNKLFVNPCSKMAHSLTLNDFMLRSDSVNKFEHKVISNLDMAKINEWNLENQRIDEDIKEIGNTALRIADRAERLGCEAKTHSIKIEEIKGITEFATADIANLNRKVQEIIGTNSNTTFCCRITLVILVFISISIIIVLIFKKLI